MRITASQITRKESAFTTIQCFCRRSRGERCTADIRAKPVLGSKSKWYLTHASLTHGKAGKLADSLLRKRPAIKESSDEDSGADGQEEDNGSEPPEDDDQASKHSRSVSFVSTSTYTSDPMDALLDAIEITRRVQLLVSDSDGTSPPPSKRFKNQSRSRRFPQFASLADTMRLYQQA